MEEDDGALIQNVRRALKGRPLCAWNMVVECDVLIKVVRQPRMGAPVCVLHMEEEDGVLIQNVRMVLWERLICVGRTVAEIDALIQNVRRAR